MAITRPLSYKGCDPEIEKALRASMSILCYISDCYRKPRKETGSREVEVVAYVQGNSKGPYLDSEGCSWPYATPAKEPVKWIMPPEKAIPILIREGWKFDEHGCLFKKVSSRSVISIPSDCLRYFGEELSNVTDTVVFYSTYLTRIIEEK